jgi:hypothetical protein
MSVSPQVEIEGLSIPIEKHAQRNFTDGPFATYEPSKTFLFAPIPNGVFSSTGFKRGLLQCHNFIGIEGSQNEPSVSLRRHASTLRSSVARGPVEPPDLAKACKMVSAGHPCWSANEATIAASWAFVSAAVPTFDPLMKISAIRPSSNLPMPPV